MATPTGLGTSQIQVTMATRTDPLTRTLRRIMWVVLVLAGAVLLWGTRSVYQGAPPVPVKTVTQGGQTLFSGNYLAAGKAAFQRYDLMDYGSLYGNGAYFGPDFTAQSLHLTTLAMQNYYAEQLYRQPYANLSPVERDAVGEQVKVDLRTNRYAKGVLSLSPAEVAAYKQVVAHYNRLLSIGNPAAGIGPGTVPKADFRREIGTFFYWSGWTSAVNRPGENFSYTNNWPYDPAAGNVPTTAAFLWTWASYLVLFASIGAVLYLYMTYISPGFEAARTKLPTFSWPQVTPSQLKTAKYFVLVAALFLLQILAGMIMGHYYADRSSFFGLNIQGILPFNILKAWHIQLAVLWIAIAWLGAGLYLAPLVGGKEPKRQGLLVDLLWGTLVVVGVGIVIGMYLGIKGYLPGNSWFWFGNQGLEYLQLGRFFQIAVLAGMVIWALIMFRALVFDYRKNPDRGNLEHLLLYSGVSIAFMYIFGMFPIGWIMQNFTLTDFWRWWVVHLWVEGTFEFFAIVVTAYALVALGLVDRVTAERATYFELILVFLGGILGTGHHYYWVGDSSVWIALGSMFSFLEVLPLLLLVVQSLHEKRLLDGARDFPQGAAFKFLAGSGLWNFFGAGVLGGLINSPLINYYEHGSFLTLAHAHAALFGAFGLLGLGLMYFALRNIVQPEFWSDRLPNAAFWLMNAGLVLWLALNFLPVGFMQLAAAFNHGYWYSRSVAFYNTTTLWQWLRMPGDILFGVGALILAIDIVLKVRHLRRAAAE